MQMRSNQTHSPQEQLWHEESCQVLSHHKTYNLNMHMPAKNIRMQHSHPLLPTLLGCGRAYVKHFINIRRSQIKRGWPNSVGPSFSS